MSKNLSPEEKGRIRDKYGRHPLLRLATQSCKRYEREMGTFRFSPEDVFLETLNVLDDLKAPDRAGDDLCDTLWDDLYCDFRSRGESLPEEELEKAVAVVMSMATYLLVLADLMCYNGLAGRLVMAISEHFKGYLEIQQNINYHAQKTGIAELQAWIAVYMGHDTYLSEEVEDCLEGEADSNISQYRIAAQHKANFAKIISAMYDLRMFEDKTGKIVSNKQNLMNALGLFFGEDFKHLSQLLGASKQNGNYTEIFDKLKEKASNYYKK